MMLIRPTLSLAKRLRVTPEASAEKPVTAQLTEWYARDFRLGQSQLVLFTNTETCLSVVMKAAPYGTLADRFREYLPLVTLHCPCLGLLWRKSEPTKNSRDRGDAVLDPELLLDHCPDSWASP